MKNYKKIMALFLSMLMLVSSIPISTIAAEKSNVCTDLHDSLSSSGELKEVDGDNISKITIATPLTTELITDINTNEIFKSKNFLLKILRVLSK